jgi:hypothetical protein
MSKRAKFDYPQSWARLIAETPDDVVNVSSADEESDVEERYAKMLRKKNRREARRAVPYPDAPYCNEYPIGSSPVEFGNTQVFQWSWLTIKGIVGKMEESGPGDMELYERLFSDEPEVANTIFTREETEALMSLPPLDWYKNEYPATADPLHHFLFSDQEHAEFCTDNFVSLLKRWE